MPTLWREPIEFAAGDTLSFKRSLGDYPASDGWSLLYEARGQTQPIEFTSTADGADHSVTVAAEVTALWLDGSYQLSGYAVKDAERHQIYLAQLTITPNAPAQPGDALKKTHAQIMVEKLEAVMQGTASSDVLESRIGETMFKYMTRAELRTEHGYWVSVRRNEIQIERAKTGRPPGNKIKPIVNVKAIGPATVRTYRGGYGGW